MKSKLISKLTELSNRTDRGSISPNDVFGSIKDAVDLIPDSTGSVPSESSQTKRVEITGNNNIKAILALGVPKIDDELELILSSRDISITINKSGCVGYEYDASGAPIVRYSIESTLCSDIKVIRERIIIPARDGSGIKIRLINLIGNEWSHSIKGSTKTIDEIYNENSDKFRVYTSLGSLFYSLDSIFPDTSESHQPSLVSHVTDSIIKLSGPWEGVLSMSDVSGCRIYGNAHNAKRVVLNRVRNSDLYLAKDNEDLEITQSKNIILHGTRDRVGKLSISNSNSLTVISAGNVMIKSSFNSNIQVNNYHSDETKELTLEVRDSYLNLTSISGSCSLTVDHSNVTIGEIAGESKITESSVYVYSLNSANITSSTVLAYGVSRGETSQGNPINISGSYIKSSNLKITNNISNSTLINVSNGSSKDITNLYAVFNNDKDSIEGLSNGYTFGSSTKLEAPKIK